MQAEHCGIARGRKGSAIVGVVAHILTSNVELTGVKFVLALYSIQPAVDAHLHRTSIHEDDDSFATTRTTSPQSSVTLSNFDITSSNTRCRCWFIA